MINITTNQMKNLTWFEVIVLTLYASQNKPMSRADIINSKTITDYLELKHNRSLSRTVSKTLNTHSVGKISMDKQHTEPSVFIKDSEGKWLLNEEGMALAKKLLAHI